MGVLGKDLFDINRPRTHVKVQFGQSAYWVEYDPTPHPYGEVLTELLNYDATSYEHTISFLEYALEKNGGPNSAAGIYGCGEEFILPSLFLPVPV